MLRRVPLCLALALTALVAGARPSAAQTAEMVGTRALGMAGAFVAVAERRGSTTISAPSRARASRSCTARGCD